MTQRDVTALKLRARLAEDFEDGIALGVVRVLRWLYPPHWFWAWFCKRWVGHDCDKQPLTCRAEFLFRTPGWMWLDV